MGALVALPSWFAKVLYSFDNLCPKIFEGCERVRVKLYNTLGNIFLLLHFYIYKIERQHAMLLTYCFSQFNSGKTQNQSALFAKRNTFKWPRYLHILFGLACGPCAKNTYTGKQ